MAKETLVKVIDDRKKSPNKQDLAREEKARFEDDGGGQHIEPTPPTRSKNR